MKHSVQLANKLLNEHHDRIQDGPVVKYPPKTAEASKHWRHTGVCPNCSLRSVSAARCAECGWKALRLNRSDEHYDCDCASCRPWTY